MSARLQEIIALTAVALIAGVALRSWWRSRQRRAAAACSGCSKGSSSGKTADQRGVVNISLSSVQSEIRRRRK